MVVRVHVTAGRGLIPEAQLCPQGLPFQPCLPLAPRRGSLPAAFAPPSASGGSGPAWPLSGSAGTTLLPATSAAPTPPPGRAETERRNGKGDRAGRRGREKRQVGGGVKKRKREEQSKHKITRDYTPRSYRELLHQFTNSPEGREGRPGPRSPGESTDLGQVEREMLPEKEAELGTGGGKETPGTGVDGPRPSSSPRGTPHTRLPSPQLPLPSVVWALAKPALTPVPARPGFSCIKIGAAQLPAHSPEPPSLTRLPSPSCRPPSSLLTHQSPQSHTAPQPILQPSCWLCLQTHPASAPHISASLMLSRATSCSPLPVSFWR